MVKGYRRSRTCLNKSRVRANASENGTKYKENRSEIKEKRIIGCFYLLINNREHIMEK